MSKKIGYGVVIWLIFFQGELTSSPLDDSYKECNYFIQPNYQSRTAYCHHDDSPFKDEFQDEVYFIANELRLRYGYNRIADVGCGSAYKLIKYFPTCETTGFEIEPTLSYLKERYPDKGWRLSDFSLSPSSDFDIVICSDVVEHLVDPDSLLNFIHKMNFTYLVISTPDRYLLGDKAQSGPPGNPAHVREWGYDEFEKYIEQYFEVVWHFHTYKEFWGQTIIAKKRME